MVYPGLRNAVMPDCVTGVQRDQLTVWQVVVTVTDVVVVGVVAAAVLFCFVLLLLLLLLLLLVLLYFRRCRRLLFENCSSWVIMERVVVIACRHFGTTYRSHPQISTGQPISPILRV